MSRRTALSVIAAGVGWSRAKSNFWDDKDPSQWSDAERSHLLANSPWAKRVEASMATSARSFGGSGKGGGGKRGGSGGGGEDQAGPPPSINVTVRWESAKPILLANRNTSEIKTDSYLISVSGLPTLRPPSKSGPNLATLLQQGTKLEVKGKGALHPEKVQRMAADPPALLFFFERAELPVTADAKEIAFTLKLGSMEIVAKFNPKEMLYKSAMTL